MKTFVALLRAVKVGGSGNRKAKFDDLPTEYLAQLERGIEDALRS